MHHLGRLHGLAAGSQLQTLAQELSTLDPGFQVRIAEIYRSWRHGLADALAAAQDRGEIRRDIEPPQLAAFLVAFWEGAIGLAKAEQRIATLTECRLVLEQFLLGIRVSDTDRSERSPSPNPGS